MMNKCSYEREDRIRNIVSRVLKYTLLTLLLAIVGFWCAALVIISPLETVFTIAFSALAIGCIFLGLWWAEAVNICERPPEANDGPFWRDATTGIKHAWVKDDTHDEGGQWEPVDEE